MIPYYEVIEDTHVVGGLITNCLLIFVVAKFSKKSLGVYKEMLLFFAAFDVFLVLLHTVLKQRVIVVGAVFGVTAALNKRSITAFYSTCNTVPFFLMIIDFLYRYLCIARPHLIRLFSDSKFLGLLVLAHIAEFTIWFLICTELTTGEEPEMAKTVLAAEYERRLGIEAKEGWLIMNYWENGALNARVFLALVLFDTIMACSFGVAITLCGLCYYHIYVLRLVSPHSLAIQRKLFISLCTQTAVPTVFVYIPYVCVLNLPFFNLPVFFWDDACMLLTTCFPAWDGLLVIILMPDYWKGLSGMLWRKKNEVRPMEMTTITRLP